MAGAARGCEKNDQGEGACCKDKIIKSHEITDSNVGYSVQRMSKQASNGPSLSDDSLDQMFRTARTFRRWRDDPIPNECLVALYDLVKVGPTSSNSCPARFVFLTSPKAKERLVPALSESNIDKVRSAPACVIIAWDNEFYERLPILAPHADVRATFVGNPELIFETAFRNSSLQGAYLIMAARALGLDCGPMSGFDAAKVNQEFFPDQKWSANFLCNLGYGDTQGLFPRAPRLGFDAACQIL